MEERINYLLQQYTEGLLNKAEVRELWTLVNEQELEVSDGIAKMIAGQVSDKNLNSENWNKVLTRIVEVDKIRTKRRSVISLTRWISYAAIVLVVLFVYKFQTKPKKTDQDRNAVVTYKPPEHNVLIASKTENSLMLLPDGSLVILGRGSVLTLSGSFNKSDSREVELIGKAFFDIKHNAARPFIIHSGKVKTVVLGTSFDIVANPGSNSIIINVIRGRVKVEDQTHELGVLTPNMQVVYDKKAEKAVVKTVDAAKELLWNKKNLEFNDVSFKDAKKLLEERFGVKIFLTDTGLQNMKFTTSLGTNETLDHFLKIICDFNNATYTYDKNTKEVSIQPLNQN